MHRAWLLALAPLVTSACGGAGATGSGATTPAALPPAATTATLAGPLCSGQSCQCRALTGEDPTGGAGLAGPGVKRFEFRLGPTQWPQWVTLGDATLYKSGERPEACFYVDLPPGEHTVQLRTQHEGGVQPTLRVREFGAAAGTWYETFSFVCGEAGVCGTDDLAEQKARYAAVRQGKHDPCGSTKVRGLTWDTTTGPDGTTPDDVTVQLTLQSYGFAPTRASGDPACVGDDNDPAATP